MNLEGIVEEAFQAAQLASLNHACRSEHWWPCGFAWVTVTPGNSKLANYLKKTKLGKKGVYKGVTVYNPGGLSTQNMDIKFAGAKAFADVLVKHGFNAQAMERMD